MILLCCKELSAKKAKNMNRTQVTKTGKPKLQLKGRIFMQNVTETVSLQKPGMSAVVVRTLYTTSNVLHRILHVPNLLEG